MLKTIITALAFLASTPAIARADEWDLCGKTSLSQVVAAIHRSDVATLSRPEMIHGSCTSQGTLKSGKPIGVQIIFAPNATIGTSIYTPLSNADPMTNPAPRQYPVGPAVADRSPSDVCGNDVVGQTVVLKLSNYFDNEQPTLGGDAKAEYSAEHKAYVCGIDWQTPNKKGRVIFTVKFNPPEVEIYKVLVPKAMPVADYDATCQNARAMVKAAMDKKAYTVFAYQRVQGKVIWPEGTLISGRPSPNDPAVTMCVSKLMIDWPPANFGVGTGYSKKDYVVSYAVTTFPNGSFTISDLEAN